MQKYKYAYIDTATTTQVFTGACTLHRIIVGETAAGAISICDAISGTTANVGTLKTSIAEGDYDFGVGLATGLRIVTGAASKITVVYSVN